MILSTSSALEEASKNSISIIVFFIGILWLLYKIRYTRDEDLRGIIEASIQWYRQRINDHSGIIIPSIFTLFAPFIFLFIFDQQKTSEANPSLLPFFLPVLSFFLGQLSVNRQKRQTKAEMQGRVILSVFDEVLYNIRMLKDNRKRLIKESTYIQDSKYKLIMLSLLRKASLEIALRSSPEILIERDLFMDTRPIIYLIDEINEVIAARQFFLFSLRESIRVNGIEPYNTDLKTFSLMLIEMDSLLLSKLDKHLEKLGVGQLVQKNSE